jgi:uncharacterized cupredoxin-like copper-binding protein
VTVLGETTGAGDGAAGAAPDTPDKASAPAPAARPARRVRPLAALAAALVVAAAGYGLVALRAGEPAPPALGPGDVTVAVDVEHSRFSPADLRVVEGTRVRFVVVNGDPINHELIVGPPSVHARHARGSEAEHPSIPGEVSVDPGGTAVTTYRFDEAGSVELACHLPGHYEFGMRGEVVVVPAA